MQEVRHDNIKVSYIMPGSVNTEFGGDQPSPEKSWQLQPEDIAQVVMDLLNHPARTLPSRWMQVCCLWLKTPRFSFLLRSSFPLRSFFLRSRPVSCQRSP